MENNIDQFNLDNCQKQVSRVVLTKAKTIVIRDLDVNLHQANQQKYVAYADDANHSYDVSIILDQQEIKAHSCDCEVATGLCEHKIAMMIFLKKHLKAEATKAKNATKPKKEKPKTPLQEYLAQAKTEDLKKWLEDCMKKDKALAMAFTNAFSPKKMSFEISDVKLIIADTRKILGRKYKVSAVEGKRVLDILSPALEPVFNFAKENMQDENIFKFYEALWEGICEFDYNYHFSGVKFIRFLEETNKKIFSSILEDESGKTLERFIDFSVNTENELTDAFKGYLLENHSDDFEAMIVNAMYNKRENIAAGKYHKKIYLNYMIGQILPNKKVLNQYTDLPFFLTDWTYSANLARLMQAQGRFDDAVDMLNKSIESADKRDKPFYQSCYQHIIESLKSKLK